MITIGALESVFNGHDNNIKIRRLAVLAIGKKAADFCLPATGKDEVCLHDYSGKWVVLFFYVKDNTSG
jgi:hypothetical protein